MKINGIILALSLLTNVAFADSKHLQIDSVEIQDVTYLYKHNLNADLDDAADEAQDMAEEAPGFPNLDDAIVKIDKIINTGKKIWEIIEKNKPVVTTKFDEASAMPEGVTHWMQLEQWCAPVSKVYTIAYKNLYGAKVVSFDMRLLLTYGGSAEGVGQYIGRAAVVPKNLSVAWGYNVNATVKVPQVINIGTKSNPIAGIELEVGLKVKTVMKQSQETFNFFVTGAGNVKQML